MRYFALSLFAISTTWILIQRRELGEGCVRFRIPRERLTMCRWIGSHFHDCIDFYGVAISAIFSRVTRVELHICEILGERKLWQVRIHKQEDSW